jgi:hypothetical protein
MTKNFRDFAHAGSDNEQIVSTGPRMFLSFSNNVLFKKLLHSRGPIDFNYSNIFKMISELGSNPGSF